ncbi:NAD(+) diphosphatase [Deinococcus humi]|uniref:NAD-capped RNA hydrolase NudC n=1 Tax=Deinococcus humi TaxID=662880 RepID=A0A7W8JUN6_9DEIO|nr:NAD(+) diphosphatase [Deinococcus humi]MBB5362141.1 NAD+ diphosphatase [Deinococcus humi]GGO21878.1 NADH pyrophosphatase [Deinococcus humi]
MVSRPIRFEDLTELPDGPATWFIFQGHKLLLRGDHTLPVGRAEDFAVDLVRPLGLLDGQPYVCAQLQGDPPDGYSLTPLRALLGRLDDDLSGLAGYAAQVLDFNRTHQFCGRCATPLIFAGYEHSKVCPSCSLSVYPRVAPVAMVLIRRGSGPDTELLLARGPNFAPGVYSALAGFVQPSETLEHAAAREVQEEVGVEIRNLRYVLSQPWPFPHSLMIGFDAKWDGGEIALQPEEIEDARWFPIASLPHLPPPFSIARQLIDRAVSLGRRVDPYPVSHDHSF